MSKSRSSPPYLADNIDHINNRVLQLHGVFGVLRSLSNQSQEVGVFPDDLGNLAWLVDDLLDEINASADKLFDQLSSGKGRK
jgi:hypothetical protein